MNKTCILIVISLMVVWLIYKKNKFIQPESISSGGKQDGIIRSIINRIGTVNNPPYYVEFGYTGAEGSNTEVLRSKGWTGLYLDGDREDKNVNLHKHFLTSDNIIDIFKQYGVPYEPDYVSIDIDSRDLWLFNRILEVYKPRLISVEYNSNIPPNIPVTVDDVDESYWTHKDKLYGTSLTAISIAGKRNGYSIVTIEPTLDAFLVRDDLMKQYNIPIFDITKTGILKIHPPCVDKDPRLNLLIDYQVYIDTGDKELARQKAKEYYKYFTS